MFSKITSVQEGDHRQKARQAQQKMIVAVQLSTKN